MNRPAPMLRPSKPRANLGLTMPLKPRGIKLRRRWRAKAPRWPAGFCDLARPNSSLGATVVSLTRRCSWIRLVCEHDSLFSYAALDRSKANLTLARMGLKRMEQVLDL